MSKCVMKHIRRCCLLRKEVSASDCKCCKLHTPNLHKCKKMKELTTECSIQIIRGFDNAINGILKVGDETCLILKCPFCGESVSYNHNGLKLSHYQFMLKEKEVK